MQRRERQAGVLVAVGYLVVGTVGYAAGGSDQTGWSGGSTLVVLWVAAAMLVTGVFAVERLSALPASVAPWAVPAVVAPLALYPLTQAGDLAGALVVVLWPLAALPLGLAVSRLEPDHTRSMAFLSLGAAFAAMILGVAIRAAGSVEPILTAGQFVAATGVAWLPGTWVVVAALGASRLGSWRSDDEIVSDAAILVACVAPVLTGTVLLVSWDRSLSLIVVVGLTVALGAAAAIRPLSRATERAKRQRELAVAVSEAERARLAADLHDGPLQDLLLLARRLEASDDREGAALARGIADDLREVSGDLRLPLLDDLGVGPALEWLTTRVHRLTGVDVSATWDGEERPPAAVELAAFRIAQEAVANAVRHGRPPISVTYRSTRSDVYLAIHDAGPRATGDAVADPDRMRLGMLGMTQRAEQIGARIQVRSAALDGTVVAVEWTGSPG